MRAPGRCRRQSLERVVRVCQRNLVLDLMYNLMLESTGRLQKCRIYEMSDNKTLRSAVAFLIVRDHAHELVFTKALESLGVNWGKVLPIPNFDATQYPEVKKLMELGVHLKQHHFRLDGSEMGKIFQATRLQMMGRK